MGLFSFPPAAVLTLLLPALCLAAPAPPAPAPLGSLACDVLIAGGSTAALSAALTAATVGGPKQQVCLTEPTDELGGQLAYNPAIDYGYAPPKSSTEWAQLTKAVTTHPSACSVSKSCFKPSVLATWVAGR